MATIEERMIRRNIEDIEYLGDLVERHYTGEFGKVLTALTQGRVMEEALRHKNGESSERVLGRIEMAAKLTQDLEQFIADRDRLRAPKEKEEQLIESVVAEDPQYPTNYGGQV